MATEQDSRLKSIEARKTSVLLGKTAEETLENQFSRAEAERQQAEQRKLLKQRGLPSLEEQKLVDLGELRQIFADRLEGQAFQRVAELMDLATTVVDVKEKLSSFEFASDIQTKKSEQNMVLLRDIHGQLEKMILMLTQELADRRSLRDQERQTLQKIDTYLDNWL